MKMMRTFITDYKLHKALDEVELWLGYKIPAVPMPPDYTNARCSMVFNRQTNMYELWYIEKEPQSQATYCHELAHLILWVNGAVTSYVTEPIQLNPEIRAFQETIWKFMQHVPVWAFVIEMGYDEVADYAETTADFIQHIPQYARTPYSRPRYKLLCQAAVLTQGLNLPATAETRALIRKAGKEMMPQALELADAILSALGPRTLLDGQEYEAYLREIFAITRFPIEDLQVSFVDRTCLNFRSRILAKASHGA